MDEFVSMLHGGQGIKWRIDEHDFKEASARATKDRES